MAAAAEPAAPAAGPRPSCEPAGSRCRLGGRSGGGAATALHPLPAAARQTERLPAPPSRLGLPTERRDRDRSLRVRARRASGRPAAGGAALRAIGTLGRPVAVCGLGARFVASSARRRRLCMAALALRRPSSGVPSASAAACGGRVPRGRRSAWFFASAVSALRSASAVGSLRFGCFPRLVRFLTLRPCAWRRLALATLLARAFSAGLAAFLCRVAAACRAARQTACSSGLASAVRPCFCIKRWRDCRAPRRPRRRHPPFSRIASARFSSGSASA